MKTLKISFFVGVLAGCLIGCKDDNSGYSLLPVSISYTVPTTQNGKVDILFVNDNSGSMSEEQSGLVANFNEMITRLNARSLDYRLAVTTTDKWNDQGNFVSNTAYHAVNNSIQRNDCNVKNPGAPKVLDYSMSDISERFHCNAAVGIVGDGREAGITSMIMALSDPNITTTNAGFLRDDAFLSVVILSDEDDSYSAAYSDNAVDTFLRALKPAQVSGDINRYYSVSAIVDTGAPKCPGFGSIGTRYKNIATLTGGSIGSICGDFAAVIANIANGIVNALSEIRLDRIPIVSTISVYLNGVNIPESATNGWQYNPSRQAVQFIGTNYVPMPGDDVRISYDPSGVITPPNS